MEQTLSFVGSYPLGMGFTFDDTSKDGVANSISEMHRLIKANPLNQECIFPYLGGEEVNDSPTHAHKRYIIDFFDRSLEEADKYPDLIQIVRTKVKPDRDRQKRDANRERWWQYAEKRPGLYGAIRDMDKVLVCGQTSKYRSFAFLPTGSVFDQKLIVFAREGWPFFAVMQSRCHVFWSAFVGSSMKDDPVYTPSDCFEPFPFPEDFEADAKLKAAGKEYYEFRAALMVKNNEGLTKTYNRFHDPSETSPDIQKLRELHAVMDQAVLDAYAWNDLKVACEFLLDYEEEDEEEDSGQVRKKKKPWRYRWPDEVRDEVLGRLLELNKQRAEQERLSGEAAEAAAKKPAKRPRKASR